MAATTSKGGDGSRKSPKSTLPVDMVFSVQVGTELFKISGASIVSDAPSYLSQFFEEQMKTSSSNGSNVRTLYVDRDAVTFRDIVRHLQGYYVKPRDNEHLVKLFVDAQFYSLPRLISQLFESDINIQIGGRHFSLPRDIFSGQGNSPNFFSLGFAIFWLDPKDVFPGLDRSCLLRPPAVVPPCVPNRSGEVFAEILHLLRGYPLHIRNENHRAGLLRDCRYYHLRGLEQKIIPHEISYNPFRQRSEIVVRLDDVRQSGVQFASDACIATTTSTTAIPTNAPSTSRLVVYARPFVDDVPYDLIMEIGGESTIINPATMHADFHGLTKARISSLFQVVANKLNIPYKESLGLTMTTSGTDTRLAKAASSSQEIGRVKIRIDGNAYLIINGKEWQRSGNDANSLITTTTAIDDFESRPAKRQRTDISPSSLPLPSQLVQPANAPTRNQTSNNWFVRTGQWRLHIQPNSSGDGLELIFVAVKLDVYTLERWRNKDRGFLSG